MPRLALFGLGAMGFGIAANLLRNSCELRITRYRSKGSVDQLVEQGAIQCQSKVQAVEQSDVVLLCLPDSDQVESVIDEISSVLEPRHLIVDLGTSSVRRTEAVAERLNSIGVAFAEAPLAGGKAQAQAAQLGAFVGADESVFARVEPLLQHFCGSIEHFGPVGRGAIAKLISNYLVLSMARSILETFHAADISQIDWEKFYRTITRGAGNSMSLQRMVGTILESGSYTGYVFSVQNALKDLKYVAELGQSNGLDSTLNDAALKLFTEADEKGYGEAMISELLNPQIRHSLKQIAGDSHRTPPK